MHQQDEMPERLAGFLTTKTGRSVAVDAYEPLTGGYSRLMAKAYVTWGDGSTEQLVLRGDPPEDHSMIHTDRDVEWGVLSALHNSGLVPMPAPRWFDSTGETLGTKAIVLDFCSGPSLQQTIETADDLSTHAADLATTLGRLHTVDPGVLAEQLGPVPSWDDHLDHLIELFAIVESEAHEAEPVLRYVKGELSKNRPPPLPLTIVHGDFQPANVMVGDDGQHLLIDWELTHIGDPREDLGYYLNYGNASPPSLYTHDPETFLARYRAVTGHDEATVNQETVGFFAAIAAVKLWGQILNGAGAMAAGNNAGLMTSYLISALTLGRQNFMATC